MKRIAIATMIVFSVALCFGQASQNQQQSPAQSQQAPAAMPSSGSASPDVLTPDALKWTTYAPGVEMAVLSGDPSGSGPFSLRLKMVDGNQIAPHWHPTDENVTVISGTLQVGMGDKFDATSLKSLPVGSHALVPKQMHHYAKASGETVVEIYGEGPFVINYLNPADDPRNAKH